MPIFTGGVPESAHIDLTSFIDFNDLILNDKVSSDDMFKVEEIAGIDDAELRDITLENPGRNGLTAYDSLYGGRTIVVTGRMIAGDFRRLANMKRELKKALSDLELHPLRFLTQGWIDSGAKTNALTNYTFDSGAGSISSSGSDYVVSTSGNKQFWLPHRKISEAEISVSFIMSANMTVDVMQKRIDSGNYILAGVGTSTMAFTKVVNSGSPVTVVSTTYTSLTVGKRYWFVGKIYNDVLTGELWNADPYNGALQSNKIAFLTSNLSSIDSKFLKANSGNTCSGWKVNTGAGPALTFGDLRVIGVTPSDVQTLARKSSPILTREVQVNELYEREFQVSFRCPDPRFLSCYENIATVNPSAAGADGGDSFSQDVLSSTGTDLDTPLTMDIGGNWDSSPASSTFDAVDFVVREDGGYPGTLQRYESNDLLYEGRYAIAGVSSVANVVVQMDIERTNANFTINDISIQGFVVRFQDSNNCLFAVIQRHNTGVNLVVFKRVAGTATTLGNISVPISTYTFDVRKTIKFEILSSGAYELSFGTSGSLGTYLTGTDNSLASGKVGIYDEKRGNSIGPLRIYDNFSFSSPVTVTNVNVINDGDYDTYPVIELKGQQTNPIINNVTTGQQMQLMVTIPSGQTYTIDTYERTIVDSLGNNLYSIASSVTDWPIVVPGTNLFNSQATSISGASMVIKSRSAWL